MSVENPNNLLQVVDYSTALSSGEKLGDLLLDRVTQPESQMVISIRKVLQAIDRYSRLNTKSIQERTGLYSNSVNRVMRLLKKKKIVKITTKNDKKNNEKIYSLNRNRAIIYLNQLILHKRKLNLMWKEIAKSSKIDNKILHYFQKDFYQKKIILPTQMKMGYDLSYDGGVTIENLPYPLGKEIMIDYMHGDYCFDCFDNGIISKPKLVDELYYCKSCHKETSEDGQIGRLESFKSRRERKTNKKMVDRQISLIKEGMNPKGAVEKSQKENESY